MTLAALTSPAGVAAQPRLPKIAVLPSNTQAPGIAAFWDELARLGWVDGRTAQIDIRSSEGDPARVPVVAREAVTAGPDVIVAGHTPVLVALRELTRTIPVVMVASGDPVELGLTESLSRPSGNFTGFPTFVDELTPKRLEVLRRIRPEGRRVALLLNPKNPLFPRIFALAQAAAAPLDWEIVVAGFESASEVLPAIDRARAAAADAVLVLPDPLAQAQVPAIVARATELRLPALFFNREDLMNGALLVYGIDRVENWRQVAGYVDRLLRGAKAADLPFVQPSRVILGINLKTARAMGLTIPLDLLGRADEVIE